MGQVISTSKKKGGKPAKGDKKSKNSKKTVVGVKDPIGVRVVFSLFILFMILTFAVGAGAIYLFSNLNTNNGALVFGDSTYAIVGELSGTADVTKIVVFNKVNPAISTTPYGVRVIDKAGKTSIIEANITFVEGDNVTITTRNEKVFTTTKAAVIGQKKNIIENKFLAMFLDNPGIMLMLFGGFVACTIVLALVHYLISPRGAKQHEKKEDVVVQTVTSVSSENTELLTRYLSTDDNIQMLDKEQNETGTLLNINYYNSVRLHNGEVYAVVKKYSETVRRLEEYGASDMDLIRMNMIGNTEFDDLILNTHKEKSMSMWEIIDFARNLDGVYCVKKRGTLNWTFKYKSKTLFIIKRDSDDSDSYKVSIKVYPDAATKLNIIYKALEDSSFPIGPYWYMFNDLRNLPANVIKWLITESLNISKWQQIKADLLRDTPDLASYKLDAKYMHDMILAGTKMFDMGKFVIITQIDTNDDVKFNTALIAGFEDMDMEQFTKEITMVVPNLKNVQMSILTRKNASEALVNSLCNELLDFNAPTENASPNPNDLNNIINTPTTTTVVKKSGKKKK